VRTPPLTTTVGFDFGGGYTGFGWELINDNEADSLADEIKLCYGVFVNGRLHACVICHPAVGTAEVIDDSQNDVLIETDENGRVIFCGGMKDGVRHGLGSEISLGNDGQLHFRDGLWQNGVCTHAVSLYGIQEIN